MLHSSLFIKTSNYFCCNDSYQVWVDGRTNGVED